MSGIGDDAHHCRPQQAVAQLVALADLVDDRVIGQIFALFVLTVAAAEAAVGLAILVTFFRNHGNIAVDDASVMKG